MKSVDAFLDYAKDHPDFDISQMTRGKFGEGENILVVSHCAFKLLNDSDNRLGIGNIEVTEKHRSLGLGAKAMNTLLAYADKYNIVLTLHPQSHSKSPISTPLLTKWYESMGFVRTPRGHERQPIA